MRTTALRLTLLLATACANSSGRNSVWLVVKNESGQSLQDFWLEHGNGAFRYELLGAGFTQGGWARVTQNQGLVMSFTDEAGARMAPPLDKALTPDMVGGVFTITLGPDGRVEENFEPGTAAPVPVDALDAPHDTALILAAMKGREDVVALLLSRGADPNARNLDRGSALGYARHGGFTRIVEMLRAAGAKEG